MLHAAEAPRAGLPQQQNALKSGEVSQTGGTSRGTVEAPLDGLLQSRA